MPFHNKNDRCYKNNNRNNYDDDEKVQNSQNSKKVVAWRQKTPYTNEIINTLTA